MPVNAQFQADFKSFEVAVQKAEQQLAQFASGADKVAPAINRMVDGIATGANTKGTPALVGMTSSLRSFDNALGAVGVNITPYVRGLSDIEQAAGQTASQLGAIATAGLALGAGIAGWNIGRAIADFFSLDQTIGNATAKLLGFGDVAGQTAGAKADVLAAATKRAGRAITDFNEALKINQEFVDNRHKTYSAFSKQLEITAQSVANLTKEQYDEIRSGEALGKSKADIAKQLGLAESVVATASKNMKDREKAAEDQHKLTAAAVKKTTDEYKKFSDAIKEATERAGLSIYTLNRFHQIGLVPVTNASLNVADALRGWQLPLESATGGIDGLTRELDEYQRMGMHAVARTLEMNKELMGLPSSAKTAENSLDSVGAAADRSGSHFGDFIDRIKRGLSDVKAEFLNWDNFMNGIMNGIFGPGGIIANLVAHGMALLTEYVIKGLAKLAGWIKDFFSWVGGLFGGNGPSIPDPGLPENIPRDPGGRRRNPIPEEENFATGTGGQYLDFGAGTRVTLHGRERVMTEAEGRRESTDVADLIGELRALVQELPRTLARANRDYLQTAVRA